jgi:hypothetical protein
MSSPQGNEQQHRQPFLTREASWHPVVKGSFQGLAFRQGLPYQTASLSQTAGPLPSETATHPPFRGQDTWTLRGTKGIRSLPTLFFRRQLSLCDAHQQQPSTVPGFLYRKPLQAVELAWRSQLAFGPSFDHVAHQMPLLWRNAAVAPSADSFESAGAPPSPDLVPTM